jgi:hypothetical protein
VHGDCTLPLSRGPSVRRYKTGATIATPGAGAAASTPTDNHGRPQEMTKVSLAKEIGTTIRAAITEWPQTVRLVSLLATASGPAALILLVVLLRHPSMSTPTIPTEPGSTGRF